MNGALMQLLRELGTVKIAAIAGVTLLLIGVFIFIAVNGASPPSTALYSNLSLEDGGRITTVLDSKNIPYQVGAGGTQIMVAPDQVGKTRMLLAAEGLPSGGSIVGYEIFDKSEALGTSNFVYNVNMLRALEGELGRTIGAFETVESARVHLVMPKRELFTRDRQEPTASVILKMRGSDELTGGQIKAISHLVATAVPGLKTGNITIVDTQGRPFKLGAEDENDPGAYASTTEEFRQAYEKRLRGTIESLLAKTLGNDKVRAEVNAEINFDRIVTNSETYDPDSKVTRSVQTVAEKESSVDKSQNENVTVSNNLPNSEAASDKGIVSTNSTERTDETTNFEISKTITNHIQETGTVKKLSIAVLVDGLYDVNAETGEKKYKPRSDAELKQLQTLVASAVGFDEKRGDKIEVINMQFSDANLAAEEKPFDWLKRDLQHLIQTLVIGVVVILVILLVIKPMVNRAFELTKTEVEEAEMQAALASTTGLGQLVGSGDDEGLIDIEQMKGERVRDASIKSVNEAVGKHPEETVAILRNWLYQD